VMGEAVLRMYLGSNLPPIDLQSIHMSAERHASGLAASVA